MIRELWADVREVYFPNKVLGFLTVLFFMLLVLAIGPAGAVLTMALSGAVTMVLHSAVQCLKEEMSDDEPDL